MVSKNISISEDVYRLLSRLKLEGESFSDTIKRLALTKGSISEYAGIWKDLSEEEFKEILSGINSLREKIDEELLE